MPVSVLNLVAVGLLFVLTLASGIWLSHAGKPINTLILTVHKLIALATGILIGVTVNRVRLDVGLSSTGIIALVATTLLFVLTVASGGWLSTGKPASAAIQMSHKVLPVLTVISTCGMIYLLASGK